MARYLIPLTLLAAIASPAWAEDLPDPTRPPLSMLRPAGSAASESATAGAPVLQTIILRKGSKPAAIIAGERVELGGSYGGARLIKLTDSEAVLSGASGQETLRLTPTVEKKPVLEKTRQTPKKSSRTAGNRK